MSGASLRMTAPVSLIGVGAQTPLGRSAPSAAAAVQARLCRLAEHPYLVDLDCKPRIVSQAPWLDDDLGCAERMLSLALPALREALCPLDAQPLRGRSRLLLSLALPVPRPGLHRDRHDWLADQLREALPQHLATASVEVFASGHAAALKALELGCQALLDNQVDACLLGGVDSYLDAETLNWMEEERTLFTASNPRGAIPGEAAAFCLLLPRHRLPNNPEGLASVAHVATAEEPAPLGSGEVCVGEGLSLAFHRALSVLPPGARVDHLLCDLNGEPGRADELAFALARTSDRFVRPGTFRTPVDGWGDVGAASGTLLMVMAAFAWARGHAPGPRILVSGSSGAHPLRGAALVQAPPSFSQEDASWR